MMVIRMIMAAGIAVALAASVLVMYETGAIGTSYVVESGAMVNQWDTAFMTKGQMMIFEGKIKSMETKLVYDPSIRTLPDGTTEIIRDRHVPHNYVTVEVTEWIKDYEGRYPEFVTYRDHAAHALGTIEGKRALFKSEYAGTYSAGDRAIFFIENLEGKLSAAGALQIFLYDDDGRVYLPYFEDHMEPFDVDEFKDEIRANL